MERHTVSIVRKPCIPDTLRQIREGESATFRAKQLGAYSSVGVAIHRMNAASGWQEYEVETCDAGVTYTVTRNRRRLRH